MKLLKKTILYLSGSLKRKKKTIEKPFQPVDSDYDYEIHGLQWDDSKLSNSYKAIKRLAYQKWR